MDALLAIVQMPSGMPVATVAINGAKNAALLAVQIGATSDPELAAKYKAYREKMSRDVMEKNDKLQQHLNTAASVYNKVQDTVESVVRTVSDAVEKHK